MENQYNIKRNFTMFLIFAIFGFGGIALCVYKDASYIVFTCSIFLIISSVVHFKHWKNGKINEIKNLD